MYDYICKKIAGRFTIFKIYKVMKKLLLIVLAVALNACVAPNEEIIPVTLNNGDFSISVDEALQNLQSELQFIEGNETRSSEPRTVKSVWMLKNSCTRSCLGATEELLYIAEFEDGRGSAVLAADRRIEPVLAILDNTVMTEQNFVSSDMDDIGNYMASMIKDYAESQVQSNGFIDIKPVDPMSPDTLYCYKRKPLLKTKWDQGTPYNDLCVSSEGEKVYAGCVAIAAAQFLKFHKYPANISINSQTFDWNLLDQCDYGKTMTLSAKNEVARFVYNIGISVGINYLGNDSGTLTKNITILLKALGYSQANYGNYNSNTIRNFVYGDNKPIIMRGINKNSNAGHAWILDGWHEYKVRSVEFLVDGGSREHIIEYKKIHCNFGWGGDCDGYYSDGLFDTTKKLPSSLVDPSVGDNIYSHVDQGYNFNYGFSMITYVL